MDAGLAFRGAIMVTPCVGVWIEITKYELIESYILVTPCVGVWIEICKLVDNAVQPIVTPCVGVWIEIPCSAGAALVAGGHSLRGSVD